ncbi:hypothetical protein FACS189421_09550 [Bacteroidia bacterium]|nr:hypothetical protein FACS189421_09550 [Bacteroidia bacterium]GHT05829.1 hypothetical protein FACS189423_10410 [Bacteroidia bacterium]
MLSFATKAQTTQLIKVSVSVADKVYDGTTVIPLASVTPTFIDAAGDTLKVAGIPAYKVDTAILVGSKDFEVVDKVVNVTITLTDPTQGYAFTSGSTTAVYTTTVAGTVTIQQAPLTVASATVNDKDYDGTTNGTVKAVKFTGLKGTDEDTDVAYTAKVTFADKNAGTGVSAAVEVTLTGSGNYYLNPSPATVTSSAAINPKKISVTGITVDNASVIYPTQVNITGATFATPVEGDTLKLTTDFTTNPVALPDTAGVYHTPVVVVLGSSVLAGNYKLGTDSLGYADYTINQIGVTVTATAQTKLYDGTFGFTGAYTTDPVVSLTGALAVKDSSNNVGVYDIIQGTLTAGNNYSITYVPAKFTIQPDTISIKAYDVNLSYGEAIPAASTLEWTVASGQIYPVAADSAAFKAGVLAIADSIAGKPQPLAKGVYNNAILKGTLGNTATNYVVKFTNGKITVDADSLFVTPDSAQVKAYRASDPVFTYTAKDKAGKAVTGITFTGALSRKGVGTAAPAKSDPVGTYNYTAGTLAASGNYVIVVDSTKYQFTIEKALVLVAPDTVSKAYNADPATNPAYTYTITLDKDTIAAPADFTFTSGGTLLRAAGENVGEYAYNADSVRTWEADNLLFALKSGANKFKIVPDTLKVTPPALQKIYGDADPNPLFALTNGGTVTGFVGPVSGDTLNTFEKVIGTQKIARVTGEDVKSYNYVNNLTDQTAAKNFVFVVDTVNKFQIYPKTITVTAKDTSKVYGAADPTLNYTVAGLAAGDDASTLFEGALSRVAGDTVGTYTINKGTLALKAPTNYSFTYNAGTFTITQADTLLVTATDIEIKYGDLEPDWTDYATTLTVTGLANGDAAADAFTGKVIREAGQNAGTYAITQGTLALKSSNYKGFKFTEGTLTITPVELIVSGTALAKVYGTADADSVFTKVSVVSGLKNADTAAVLTGKLGRVDGEAADTYAYTAGTLSAAPNYTITVKATPVFTIDKAPVTVTAKADTIYFGEADPTFKIAPAVGLINNTVVQDSIENAFTGELSRVAGTNVGDYTIKKGSLDAANYTITFTEGAALTILPSDSAHIPELVFGDLVYVYDGNPYSAQVSIAGIPSNAFTVLYNEREGAPINAGDYTIKVKIAATPNNEALEITADTVFTIEKAEVTVTIDNVSKLNGQSDPTFTYASVYTNPDPETHVGILPGVPFTGKLEREAGEATGKYVISKGTLDAGGNYTLTFVDGELTITPGTGIDNIVAEGQVSIYPSVAQRNSTITLDANVNVNKAELAVYSINGKLISVTPVINTVTTLSAPSEAGAYIYVFKSEGINKTMKVLVK